ncbi:MAG: capsular biosynthesis protein [Clostridiales bacterium]|nr:capsular biosynthesis protein [Clostridiales bacterium]
MIDIHSHILPGIDDGAKNQEETLEMLKTAEKDGTKKIIATPHYCKEYAEEPLCKVNELLHSIRELVKDNNIDLEIFAGQEIYIFDNIINYYKEGIIGTINKTKYMLIEFPMNSFKDNTLDLLYELQLLGVQPIIAHPERYLPIIKNPREINKFIEEGMLFQLNAGSITGKFGKDVMRTCKVLLENNMYSFIGSDAHNTGKRNTSMKESINYLKSNFDIIGDSFAKNGQKLLDNINVDFIGNKIQNKKSIFDIFKK